MEEFIKHIYLQGEDLRGKPLFFRKILFNRLTDPDEEKKLIKYSQRYQSDVMRNAFPNRQISKTVDMRIFNQNEDE